MSSGCNTRPFSKLTRPASRLLYFTFSFPYGHGEEWKFNDIEVFAKRFDEVVIVPLSYGNKKTLSSNVPESVVVHTPLFETESVINSNAWLLNTLAGIIYDRLLRQELRRCLSKFDLRGIREVGRAYVRGKRIAKQIHNTCLCDPSVKPEETSLFFFWGLGAAEGLPWIEFDAKRIVVGYHGYDLYESRRGNQPFPFRTQQLEKVDLAAPCSNDGAVAMAESNRAFAGKIQKRTLGSRDFGVGPWSRSSTCRLVSCAFTSRVKRLDLLINALSLCKADIEWTHIGGGTLLSDLKDLSARLISNQNVKFRFLGSLEPIAVREYFSTQEVDALVSTSKFEGLPVSMMEAISAGIPVIGTDVGGVREIIDSSVGLLLPMDPSPADVAKAIDKFANQSENQILQLRHSARKKFLGYFCVPDVIEAFSDLAFPDERPASSNQSIVSS